MIFLESLQGVVGVLIISTPCWRFPLPMFIMMRFGSWIYLGSLPKVPTLPMCTPRSAASLSLYPCCKTKIRKKIRRKN